MRAVSFSLYGNDPRYTIGAIKNAILGSRYFPFEDGFRLVFYCGQSVEEWVISTLNLVKGVKIVRMSEAENNTARLWRYLAFSDLQFEVVICRDADARLSFRDRIAHEEWEQSGLDYHIIKDHPSGHNYPISAGMFAGKTAKLRDMAELIAENNPGDFYTTDQAFLEKVIYPWVKDSVLIHDPFYNTPVEGKSIRTGIAFDAPTRLSHIGAALDENDRFIFRIDRDAQLAEANTEKYKYESDRWGK
jgi:hypothetical protein